MPGLAGLVFRWKQCPGRSRSASPYGPQLKAMLRSQSQAGARTRSVWRASGKLAPHLGWLSPLPLTDARRAIRLQRGKELTLARQQAADHAHREERLRRVEKSCEGRGAKGLSTRSGREITGRPPPTLRAGHGRFMRPSGGECGNGLSVNSVTTCPFAENVQTGYCGDRVREWNGLRSQPGHGSGLLDVLHGLAPCVHGGEDAAVYFP